MTSAPAPATPSTPGTDQRPTITVVVAAYNAQDTIGATVSSVLTQDYPHVDVVVVDDGSHDATAAFVQGHIDAGMPVTLVRQDNAGVSAARNAGLRRATGELVAVLDADDQMLPGYLSTAAEIISAAPGRRAWVTFDGYLLTDGGLDPRRTVRHLPVPAPRNQARAILEGNFATCFSVLPAAALAELGGYDESLAGCEDWDLWARAIISGWPVHVVTRPSALYRWSPGSLSSSGERMADGEEAMLTGLRARYADRLSPADLAYLDERIAAGSIMRLGRRADDALRSGDMEAARALYTTAARLTPTDRRSAVKARTLAVPGGFSFWRRRLLAADQATGRDKVAR